VAIASTYKDHIVVAGIGRLGYRIVQQLLSFDEDVVGIEIDADGEFARRVMNLRVPIIFGDATHPDVLRQAGVERAAAIVPCTQDDLTNLEIALIAREIQEGIHVVLRMFDHDMAQKVARGFDIQTAFSTSALAAPAFARAATRADISHAFYVGDHLLNVSEIQVRSGSPLDGRVLGELEHDLDFSTVLHSRGKEVDMHPNPATTLQAGDRICVFASLDVLNQLEKMNR